MYSRHRFPAEIISYAVWLYYAFPLSYWDVQKLLLERDIDVSHEAIRVWCQKFGQQFANEIRRRRRRVEDKWYLDEMVVTINQEQYYLWRCNSMSHVLSEEKSSCPVSKDSSHLKERRE